ncbi:MAG: hypothetical protein KC619_14175 [Myxococcales bacterium]|nr:hypothetical protein [Myxococcales bacterium]
MAKDSKGDHPLIHRLPVKDRSGKIVGYKEVASYRGLLHLAHESGLRSVRTELVQLPSPANDGTAIVRAVVRTGKGTFTGIGDANPKNVNPKVAPHAIRMAETRAEARAFRKALDIGIVALEELEADLDEGLTYEGAILPASAGARPSSGSDSRTESRPGNGSQAPAGDNGASADDYRATEKQRKFLFRLVHEAGYSGEGARDFLHKELGVASVKDASKAAVSALIDRIKSGAFNRGNGHSAGALE